MEKSWECGKTEQENRRWGGAGLAAGQKPRLDINVLLTEAGFKMSIMESRGKSGLPEDGDEK